MHEHPGKLEDKVREIVKDTQEQALDFFLEIFPMLLVVVHHQMKLIPSKYNSHVKEEYDMFYKGILILIVCLRFISCKFKKL